MADDPLIGAQVGNYRIVGLLGEGGMARVYRATHPEIGREVAIKVLAPEVAAMPDVVRRFRIEAQTVNKIDHPNIIHIFDFGTLPDGRQFYLMELLAGESLADRIQRAGAMPLDEALAITDAILDALSAVHHAGIVHRDLKPDNVFLSQSGGRSVVKLLDFGIVKLLGETPFNKTRTGSLLGTPSYMAPEQCQGKVDDIGPRTDLYAVGCILYQMLSGILPFNAESLGGLLMQHITETPRPLTDRIRGLPLALSQLVQQCLAKEPQQRPLSAAWLREQLRPFVAQGPALVVAETLAALDGSAPHATQTITGRSPQLPIITPPNLSSPQVPRTHEPAQRKQWPLIAGVGVVGLAGIAVALVVLTRRQPAPASADAAVDAPAEPTAVTGPPVDTPPLPDAAPDAAVPPDATEAADTLKTRLLGLKRMCDDGLFTEAECKSKREEILREWDKRSK